MRLLLTTFCAFLTARCKELEVHHSITYFEGRNPFGSFKYNVNSRPPFLVSENTTDIPQKSFVIGRIEDLTVEMVSRILKNNYQGGLLVVIPSSDKKLPLASLQKYKAIEDLIKKSRTYVPVFFIEESTELETELTRVTNFSNKPRGLLDFFFEEYPFISIKAPAATRALNPLSIVHHGSIDTPNVEKAQFTLSVFSRWDSSAVAPGLAIGAKSSATGASVLLTLLSSLTASVPENPFRKFSTQFILSGTSYANYDGVAMSMELAKYPSDFVLCLDDLIPSTKGQSIKLYLKNTKGSEKVASFVSKLEETFLRLNKPLEIVTNSSVSITQPHHVFAALDIPSATLTYSEVPAQEPFFEGSIFDRSFTTEDVVMLREISRALLTTINASEGDRPQGINDTEIDDFVSVYLTKLTQTARFVPSMTPVDLITMQDTLSGYFVGLDNVKVYSQDARHDVDQNSRIHYRQMPSSMTLTFETSPMTHLLYASFIFAGLALLYNSGHSIIEASAKAWAFSVFGVKTKAT